MRSGVFARGAAVTAVLVLIGIGCSAGSDQDLPATSTSPPPSPTAAVAPIAAASAASGAAESPSLEDRLSAMDLAMAGMMLGEFPDAEELAAIAPDSSPDMGDLGDTPDLGDTDDLEGRAISAVPAGSPIDDQGNLPQPVTGDALIDFTLPLAGGGELTLSEIGGDQNTVLVFYRAFW